MYFINSFENFICYIWSCSCLDSSKPPLHSIPIQLCILTFFLKSIHSKYCWLYILGIQPSTGMCSTYEGYIFKWNSLPPISYLLSIITQLRDNFRLPFPPPCWDFTRLQPVQLLCVLSVHYEFIRATALLCAEKSFLVDIHCFWLFRYVHVPFLVVPQASGVEVVSYLY